MSKQASNRERETHTRNEQRKDGWSTRVFLLSFAFITSMHVVAVVGVASTPREKKTNKNRVRNSIDCFNTIFNFCIPTPQQFLYSIILTSMTSTGSTVGNRTMNHGPWRRNGEKRQSMEIHPTVYSVLPFWSCCCCCCPFVLYSRPLSCAVAAGGLAQDPFRTMTTLLWCSPRLCVERTERFACCVVLCCA